MKNKQALLYASLLLLSSTFANAAASDKDDGPRPPRRAAKRVRIDSQGRILPDHAAAAASTLVDAPTSTDAKRPRGVAQAAAYLPSRNPSDTAAVAGLSFLSSDSSDTTAAIAAGVALLSSYPSDTAAAEGLGGARLSSSSSSSVVADQGLDPEFYAEIMFARALELCLGKEVPRDFQEGYRLLDHAARLRHPAAEYGMARMLYHGYGRDKDFETAFHYLSRSAKQKYPQAMYMLFELYSSGEDVPQDDKIAQKYLMDSANRGYNRAQYELGRRLSYDKSNPANRKLAFHYLTCAAKEGFPGAQSMLEEIFGAGESASGSLEISSPAAAPTRRISIPSLTEVYPGLPSESRGNPGASAAAAAARPYPLPRLGRRPVNPASSDPRFARPPFAAAAAAAFAGQQVLHLGRGSGLFPVLPQLPWMDESAAGSYPLPHSAGGGGMPRLLPAPPGLFPVLPGMDSRFARPPFAAAAAFAGQQVPHSAGGMPRLPINRVLFSGVPQVTQRSLAPRTADESAAASAAAGPYPLPRSADERAPGINTEHLG
tara:strand:- start:8160 stop:9788 length:1629 start_codon:yes stop_codon:yes gene_type:complete